MDRLSLPKIAELLEFVAMGANQPLMIWGPAGVGKSGIVAQLAAKHKAALVDVRLGQYDSVDLRGFPSVDAQTNTTTWHPPSTLPFVSNPAFTDKGRTLLFLDEMNAASPAVAGVAYQLIHERRVGEHALRPNVRIVAAGNRDTDKGVTNRMPAPLANRMVHVEAEADVDAFCFWAQGEGLTPIGLAFLQFRRDLLTTFDPASTAKEFASPRTWEMALRFFDMPMPEDLKHAAIAGSVGNGPATELFAFKDYWHKVTPIKDILKDPTGVKTPEEAAMQYATAVQVSGHMSVATAAKLHLYLKRMSPELQYLSWRLAVKRDGKLIQTDAFTEVAQRIKAVW
mgnify:CR=1 FL=1